MKKINIVKENRDFNKIIEKGSCYKNKYFILNTMKNEINHYRFGISISKKTGNAVIRNLYKRKLRNIIDANKKLYSKDKDYIIIIRKNCLDVEYKELEKQFLYLIKNSNLSEEK
ncbi:MAG: ribonuclease P protein component [Bacilli bacterium]|nr:ribonuclease P protein component [Bacilli bacterium]